MKLKFQKSSLKAKAIVAFSIAVVVSYGGFLMFFIALLSLMIWQDFQENPS